MLNNKIQISVISSSKAKAIRDLHELIHLAEYCPKKVKMLLIKPNVCGMYPPDIKLLEKIVETFEPYAESIIIGETNSTMNSSEDRFRRLGITDLAKRHGVEARNLMKDSVVKKRVPQPHAMVEVPLPSTVLEADVLINVPGIGRHGTTLLTCAMKNLFGLIATSSKYASLHPLGVDRVIADVYQTAKPNLNVVDAGSQILVSTDTLGVDMVAAGIMRMDPLAVEHLVLASRDRGILLENLNINRIIL